LAGRGEAGKTFFGAKRGELFSGRGGAGTENKN